MPDFDLNSAIPIADNGGVATKPPEFDINTALRMTEPVDSEESYDAFTRSQLHRQIKDNIHRPLSSGETSFVQDTEAKDPGALQSFLIPYTEGVVGFFTKPFGYRPDLSKPFGLEKGPKPQEDVQQDIAMEKAHPVAFTLGQIISGTVPFIAIAPLFPQSLLGTIATFETVGLTRKIGEIQADESLLMPPGEKVLELGREAVKSGILAPIWHYSGALKFIGRPYLSAITRAGVRGTGTAGLEAVFGTDLEQALKQGGIVTALSLIFEAPTLAKTALGRGIIARANEIASAKGLPEGKYIINVDKLDEASTRSGLLNLVKGFYNLMRTKIEKPASPIDPAKQVAYDRLASPPETPPVKPPEDQGGTIWAPKGIRTPPSGQPMAGGMVHLPQKAPIFYSKMSATLAEKMPESASVSQIRGILDSSGIPKEEIAWSGVEDFLKSKLSTPTGEGKVIKGYHGTNADIKEFVSKENIPEEYIDFGGHTFGTYFADNKKLAGQFGDKIIEADLDIKKPLDLTSVKTFEDLVDKLPIDKEKNKITLRNMKLDSRFDDDYFTQDVYRALEKLVDKFKLVPEIEKLGHDGVIFNDRENGVKGKTYIVLNPKQIKLSPPTGEGKVYYRGGPESAMPKGMTAQDIINYEQQELGNQDVVVEKGIDLAKIKSDNLQWVTIDAKSAKEYGKVVKQEYPNTRIIAKDSQGGVLIENISTPTGEGKEYVAYRGYVEGAEDKQLGGFYSIDKDIAKFYADYKGEKTGQTGKVRKETLIFNNPLMIKGLPGPESFESIINYVPQLQSIIKRMYKDIKDIEMDNLIVEGEQIIANYAKNIGHDAVVFENGQTIINLKGAELPKLSTPTGEGKVSKAELLDYLQKNQMTIEETIKETKAGSIDIKNQPEVRELKEKYGWTVEIGPEGELMFRDPETEDLADSSEMARFAVQENNSKLAAAATLAHNIEIAFSKPLTETKYSLAKYNVVTENYREMLLKIPSTHSPEQQRLEELVTKKDWTPSERAEVKALEKKFGTIAPKRTDYQEPHWDEPNVFAHARTADTTDSQDRKGLFINEIQSRWNQDLRKFKEAMQKPVAGEGFKPVPSHPVVARWHEVILKRLLRYAAENGYDFISWATGEQVAGYYDLSKQVDKIQWRKQGKDDIEFVAVKNGETHIEKQVPKKELENYIGKDAANKILQNMELQEKTFKKNIRGELSGLDLKVGGAWAKNLYSERIPKWLNDYAKKFGVQVETVNIKAPGVVPTSTEGMGPEEAQRGLERSRGEQVLTQQSLAITPEMKQALLSEGQPIFGKMTKDVGAPGKEFSGMKIFRMDEDAKVTNTKGEIVTLPKGEEYRTLPVYDSDGNLVPNKVKLQDGKQITVYEGELNKLKGKILGEGDQPMAGGLTHPPTPEEGQPPEEKPKPRIEQRKAEMEMLNTPDITSKLLFGDKEFIKKYISEGKSLEETAKELGEDIEDVKKTEMWAHARMQEISEEQEAEVREHMEQAARFEESVRRDELRVAIVGKIDINLKQVGEYANLKHLPWLFSGQGKGPDELTDTLNEVGFPVENDNDVRALIEEYFKDEINARAETSVARQDKTKIAKLTRETAKAGITRKTKQVKPERTLSGVGNGSVISDKENIDYEERAKIFRGMPFALLGNKAEVLSRLPGKFKAAIKQGIKKVYDLWGGGKGYRSGLFPELPGADYSLNELSDERSNYYRNIQDPEKLKAIQETLEKITNEFEAKMKDAFGLPEAKSDSDFLGMLNSWLKLGLQRERYYFAREIIQGFGNRLLNEAKSDKFASPESSAKYFFLENTSIFGVGPDGWTQGIIRTTKGDAYIRDVLNKIAGLSEKLATESKRDKDIPITQEDAWTKMDTLTQDLTSGELNPKETAVMVDPQYLNPTEEAGTYSVGSADNVWQGHKQNLERHFLPLVKTGAKIIYTNNADHNLITWLRANKLPYNIEKSIGAVAERRGRDEVISFIGFGFGPEWTMGQVQPGGTGAIEPGQQYVAERVTGQSAKFTEWLAKQEAKRQAETKKQELVAKIEQLRQGKMLSKITVSRIKKYLGVKELKNTGVFEIEKVVEYINGLKAGDKLLSEGQIKILEKMFGEIKDIAITPKRIAVERFGENAKLMEGLITSHIALELIPTVDIKQGNRAVTKIVDSVHEKLEHAESEIHRRDDQLEAMLRKAQNARSEKLTLKESAKRKLIKQDREIFMALSGQKVDLTPEEMAVVTYLKDFFKIVKEKLALEKYRKNYVTHLEQPLMEKIMNVGVIGAVRQYFEEQSLKKEIPTDIILELDNIIGSEKFFRFALERKGGIIPSTNIQKIVHDYSSLFETKIALDQILPEGQVVTKLLLQGKDALWLKKFLQNLKGRGLDNEFRTGRMGWLARIADEIVDLGYVKLLSLNYWSAIKNIVAGEANAIIWQDLSAYLKGKQRFISAPKKAYKLAIEHGILEGTYADYAVRGIGKLKKLQDLSMIGQKAGEVEIRTSMFIGELTDTEWEAGEISPGRLRKLKDSIAITQGIFSKTESPLWVQTVLGRVIMQMNRWRITNAMLLRRIVNDAKEEWSQGNFKGQNSQRLSKALLFYAIGMYASYELGKAGFKKAAQIAQSMAEVVNSLISLISQGDLKKMITDNPTLSVMKEILFSAQQLTRYIHIPGATKPRKVEFNQGIEETYIAPLDTIKDLLDEIEQ